MGRTVLLVDDEKEVLSALRRLLTRDCYEVLTAEGGREALTLLNERDVAVIVCDQRMPGMSGVEVLEACRQLRPDAIRITLTAYTDLNATVESINRAHVHHFLLKPWCDGDLRDVIRDAVQQHELKREVVRLNELTRVQRDELQALNQHLEQKVAQRTDELQAAYEDTLTALVRALDVREHATAGHSRRVATCCLFVCMQIGVPEEELENVYRGGLLHDIGKIGVPDAVLLKPGRLTPEERQIVECHVSIGAEILASVRYLKSALSIPLYHHEKYDGTGYCQGLRGEDIPIEARPLRSSMCTTHCAAIGRTKRPSLTTRRVELSPANPADISIRSSWGFF